MISTHTLAALPLPSTLRPLTQSLALLDAILQPEWDLRYHSFHATWSTDDALASMRTGGGDHYFLLFMTSGTILKGFAHEAPMSPFDTDPPGIWPGVLDAVPSTFASFLSEPAFVCEETTFCVWHRSGDTRWQCGTISYPDDPDPDGSRQLLALLDGSPQTYQVFAEEYYERPINLAAVVHIYQHKPLTDAIIAALNPALSLRDIQADLDEIAYP